MGCSQNLIYSHRLHHFTVSILFLLISTSTHLKFIAEGRTMVVPADRSEEVKEEKGILRAQIGSRPPRCDRWCSSCGHCEAIQVPTDPQIRSRRTKNSTVSMSTIAYSRGNYNSNYKPMSWKCKCGKFIFNP